MFFLQGFICVFGYFFTVCVLKETMGLSEKQKKQLYYPKKLAKEVEKRRLSIPKKVIGDDKNEIIIDFDQVNNTERSTSNVEQTQADQTQGGQGVEMVNLDTLEDSLATERVDQSMYAC